MKIEFEIQSNGVLFKDAIDLPDDHNLSESQIDEIKQKRFDDWLAATAPELVEE